MKHRGKDEASASGAKLHGDRAVRVRSAQVPHREPQGVAGVQGARSGTSVRAEQAWQHWTAKPVVERPLEVAARNVARELDKAMMHFGYTNEAVADFCNVHEKEIRQWRAAHKRIPLAAILVMPSALAVALLGAVAAMERVR